MDAMSNKLTEILDYSFRCSNAICFTPDGEFDTRVRLLGLWSVVWCGVVYSRLGHPTSTL
jgi:hypothetical protein